MIKAVIFDMDGTLVNSEKHYVDGTLFWIRRLGIECSREQIVKIVGMSEKETYDYLSSLINKSYEETKRINEDYFEKENPLNYQNYQFDDVLDTLIGLRKKGIKIAICSMSNKEYVERCIKQLSLNNFIDYYICGDSGVKPKPNPDCYLKAVKELGFEKEECVVVEDSFNGILSSKNAGLFTYARKDKQFGIDQSSANIILDSLTDLLKVINV